MATLNKIYLSCFLTALAGLLTQPTLARSSSEREEPAGYHQRQRRAEEEQRRREAEKFQQKLSAAWKKTAFKDGDDFLAKASRAVVLLHLQTSILDDLNNTYATRRQRLVEGQGKFTKKRDAQAQHTKVLRKANSKNLVEAFDNWSNATTELEEAMTYYRRTLVNARDAVVTVKDPLKQFGVSSAKELWPSFPHRTADAYKYAVELTKKHFGKWPAQRDRSLLEVLSFNDRLHAELTSLFKDVQTMGPVIKVVGKDSAYNKVHGDIQALRRGAYKDYTPALTALDKAREDKTGINILTRDGINKQIKDLEQSLKFFASERESLLLDTARKYHQALYYMMTKSLAFIGRDPEVENAFVINLGEGLARVDGAIALLKKYSKNSEKSKNAIDKLQKIRGGGEIFYAGVLTADLSTDSSTDRKLKEAVSHLKRVAPMHSELNAYISEYQDFQGLVIEAAELKDGKKLAGSLEGLVYLHGKVQELAKEEHQEFAKEVAIRHKRITTSAKLFAELLVRHEIIPKKKSPDPVDRKPAKPKPRRGDL